MQKEDINTPALNFKRIYGLEVLGKGGVEGERGKGNNITALMKKNHGENQEKLEKEIFSKNKKKQKYSNLKTMKEV